MTDKKLLRFAVRALTFCAGCSLLTPGLAAQSAGTGLIEGRVLNATDGTYVNNVRVTIKGTRREAFTNEFGEYRFADVPAGTVKLDALFSGFEQETATVAVTAGATAHEDFNIAPEGYTGSKNKEEIVQLGAFVVNSSREMNATARAVNEQRFAPNLKNVVNADAFGDVTEGNVGEFVKYLPGVTVDYVAADVRTIAVRGFADNFTAVSVDGARMASAASGNANRVFELEQVSINNVARVEVTKEPTPDMPATGLGGSVNMISRSAFERARPVFKYKTYLSMNSEDRDLFRRTPGPANDRTFKVLPGFDFNYIAPLSPTLGIVINGLSSNQFNEQHRSQTQGRFKGAGATPDAPYLRRYQLQDGPKNTYRDSLSAKVDWKFAPGHVLSLSAQANYYKAFFGNRNLNFDTGSSNKARGSSIAPKVNLTYGPDFTHGATNRGNVTQGSSWRDKLGATRAVNAHWRYTGRLWQLDAGANASVSKTWYRDDARGHFSGVGTQLIGISRVLYDRITYPRPQEFTALDTAGQPINYLDLHNFEFTRMRINPVDGKAQFTGARFNARREFESTSFPLAMKAGVAVRREVRDNRRNRQDYDFVGPDGKTKTADDNAGAYLDRVYSPSSPYWGFQPIQWADAYKVYDLYRAHPDYFRPLGGGVNAEDYRISNSERIAETVSAGYLQFETRLFNNRLNLVTGVRYEKTEDDGVGVLSNPDAIYRRNADGSFVHDSSGKRVLVTTDPIAQLHLRKVERGFHAKRSYGDFYPGFHATLNLTDNLLARFAYAKTLGRPNYSNIIPNIDINEDEFANPGDPPGHISQRNTGLKPWTAQNFDLSLEYYFPRGGLVSVGGFQKNISNFWGTLNTILTPALASELGIDPDLYADWTVSTQINVGDAKVSGAEFNFSHPLSFLGEWGKDFNLGANATMLHLQGSNEADFKKFIAKSGNLSLTYSHRPLIVMVKWNYRGRQRNGTSTDMPGGFEYYAPRYNLDLNVEYQLSKRLSLFANARNVTNIPQTLQRYSDVTPAYRRNYRIEEFGVQFAFGLKGTF